MSSRPIIKNYSHGRASNEGNGMIGGRWWGCQHLAHLDVYVYEFLNDVETSDDLGDRWEKICAWFESEDKEMVTIEAYINEGEDESTNCYEFDVDETFYPTEFDEYINACPLLTESEKENAIRKFGEYVDNCDAHDFDLYEPDYPDEYDPDDR